MKQLVLLLYLTLLILAGCAELKDPMEFPERLDGSSYWRSSSPFYDATRPQRYDDLPTWESRPAKEREAFRERHR